MSETCQNMYEESIKCNEHIPFNYTAYYEDSEEWEETLNNVTCAFLESVQQANNAIASNSYSMTFYATISSPSSLSGGQFFLVGAAVAFVGAAVVAVRSKNSKTIGQDLNAAFVDGVIA